MAKLATDPAMVRAFAHAFPQSAIGRDTLAKVVATYLRTLVSPRTRFDGYVLGDRARRDLIAFLSERSIVQVTRSLQPRSFLVQPTSSGRRSMWPP